MKKFFKIIIAIFGAGELVFNLFLPVAMGLTLVSFFELSPFNNTLVMVVAMLATIYRTMEVVIK